MEQKLTGKICGGYSGLSFYFGIISLTPSNFSHFCKHPPNIQKLSLTPFELSKFLTYPHPYKLGHKFFKKKTKIPMFFIF
jgi:hypothetical protein